MLLPDNVNPELSIYYNGALIIVELNKKKKQRVMELYGNIKREMSFSTFILSLDWLYLINVAIINDNDEVELCS